MRILILFMLCVAIHAEAERRDIVERAVIQALASGKSSSTSFHLRIGEAVHAATVVASDDATLTATVDGARLTMPWSDVADADLLTLAQALLGTRAEIHLMLAQFAYDAGLIDQARSEIGRHVAAGGKDIAVEERKFEEKRLELELERRQLEVARARREQLAEQAWARVEPLLADPRKRDQALTALREYEHAWEGTEFLIGKSAEIVTQTARLRAER